MSDTPVASNLLVALKTMLFFVVNKEFSIQLHPIITIFCNTHKPTSVTSKNFMISWWVLLPLGPKTNERLSKKLQSIPHEVEVVFPNMGVSPRVVRSMNMKKSKEVLSMPTIVNLSCLGALNGFFTNYPSLGLLLEWYRVVYSESLYIYARRNFPIRLAW